MDITEKAYMSGMAEIFKANGLTKKASQRTAQVITKMTKRAALFNFSDSNSGGLSLSNILIPLLAAGGAGYIAYNAGQQGDRNKSSFTNIKNYLNRHLTSILRNNNPPAIYDWADNTTVF